MSASLYVTFEEGTTTPTPEDFFQFCMDQVLRYEPGNGAWYGRFTEVSIWTGNGYQVSFSTTHTDEKDAIPEVCELATAFWAKFSGRLAGDDRCTRYIAWLVATCGYNPPIPPGR
jgi:hypothetical protein